MAFYTNHISHGDTSLIARISGFFAAEKQTIQNRIARSVRVRRTMAQLAALSDRELADIGLSRTGLKRAALEAARARG